MVLINTFIIIIAANLFTFGYGAVEVTVIYDAALPDQMIFKHFNSSICQRYSASFKSSNRTHVVCECKHRQLFFSANQLQYPRCQDENFGSLVGCPCPSSSCMNYFWRGYEIAQWKTESDIECGLQKRSTYIRYWLHTGEWYRWAHQGELSINYNYFAFSPRVVTVNWRANSRGPTPDEYQKYSGILFKVEITCGAVPKACFVRKGIGIRTFIIQDTLPTKPTPPPTTTTTLTTTTTPAKVSATLTKTKTSIFSTNDMKKPSNAPSATTKMAWQLIVINIAVIIFTLLSVILGFVCWRKRKSNITKKKLAKENENTGNDLVQIPGHLPDLNLSLRSDYYADPRSEHPYEEITYQQPFVLGYLRYIESMVNQNTLAIPPPPPPPPPPSTVAPSTAHGYEVRNGDT